MTCVTQLFSRKRLIYGLVAPKSGLFRASFRSTGTLMLHRTSIIPHPNKHIDKSNVYASFRKLAVGFVRKVFLLVQDFGPKGP
jgi:hypothetical protein